MTLTIDHLPEPLEQFIQAQTTLGGYRTAEEFVVSILVEKANQTNTFDTSNTRTRQSTRGILAHHNFDIGFEEIEASSREACGNFPREFPNP